MLGKGQSQARRDPRGHTAWLSLVIAGLGVALIALHDVEAGFRWLRSKGRGTAQ